MRTLRIAQTGLQGGQHEIQLTLDGDAAHDPQTATVRFAFEVSAQDREDLRWYLEEYLQYPTDPAPTFAARVERRMVEIGEDLFTRIFGGRERWRLWEQVVERLFETRVEISSEVEADAVLPWELLQDPRTGTALAVTADTFVRTQHPTERRAQLPQPRAGERMRMLLVISRPAGGDDVPFRSVAGRLVRLGEANQESLQLDVLRPATFTQLVKALREAADRRSPYHVVHFDGHGVWTEIPAERQGTGSASAGGAFYSLLSPVRSSAHGYLLFEDPTTWGNQQLVDGPALGQLLSETGVPVLVLNACQSAHAELTTSPETVEDDDVHERFRTYGSLAQEIVDAGVAGVVAMRYSVYVVTAAQFIADVYAALLQGHRLGTAVRLGRRQLKEQPNREIAFQPRPLQDWMVPVVYEAAPLKLFPEPQRGEQVPSFALRRAPNGRERAKPDSGLRLPDAPDVGFFGRDETLLALDRAFDNHSLVLLHGYAGAGKTATAAEFARWYQLTGGVDGPVLFTTFEQYHTATLPQVLDQLGQEFEEQLEAQGVQWLTLSDAERRKVALEILRQESLLWIWDNVEPVTGFPAGIESEWSQTEQDELVAFLRDLRDTTKVKVLLTSRRDEHAWLGDLPIRIKLPPMPMTDQVELARALAERHGHRLTEVGDWRPLLAYTQGNPLTVSVLVGQALHDCLHTRQQLADFVERLRAGEADLRDDAAQGRTRSLGASLTYGLEHAFSQQEREVLALLHLFQGFVQIGTLTAMGDTDVVAESVAPAVRGMTREAGIELLGRATEVGLLASYSDGYYAIHPALPWYLHELFAQTSGSSARTHPNGLAAKRSYATAIARLGEYYRRQYYQGHAEIIRMLGVEEANLLHAWQLARTHGWWDLAIGSMQGLRPLYEHTGRQAAWARLVEQVTPGVIDTVTDGPRSGHEAHWTFLTEYRAGLARQVGDYPAAQRLLQLLVARAREQADASLAADPATLDDDQRSQLHTLSGSLHEMGQVLREQQRPDCLEVYEEALALAHRIGDRSGQAAITFNVATAYLVLPTVRDLDKAEDWTRRTLELCEVTDWLGRARCISQLGLVHRERFLGAQAAELPRREQVVHLQAAAMAYQQALALYPPDAVRSLAIAHNQLGLIYDDAEQSTAALDHYRRSIRYKEAAKNWYGAALTRFNVARALIKQQRFDHALEWAQAALRGFESSGDRALGEVSETRQLIELIQQAMPGGQG